MRRLTTPRHERPDLLVRPPCGTEELERRWTAMVVDPVEQLVELADLRSRGLLSAEEYEAQKSKVIRS